MSLCPLSLLPSLPLTLTPSIPPFLNHTDSYTLNPVLHESTSGDSVDEQLQGGLVLFWSLRNPEHPEKVLRTPYPVCGTTAPTLQSLISSVATLALNLTYFLYYTSINYRQKCAFC